MPGWQELGCLEFLLMQASLSARAARRVREGGCALSTSLPGARPPTSAKRGTCSGAPPAPHTRLALADKWLARPLLSPQPPPQPVKRPQAYSSPGAACCLQRSRHRTGPQTGQRDFQPWLNDASLGVLKNTETGVTLLHGPRCYTTLWDPAKLITY